ncbi:MULTISPECIES: CDP-glucose 4,6-dehydratase [Chitinophaga]|uniref:CDP-glucose 4,6-dehydratase n=1 Tax=Chitinophaga TaxID=79328 RepID=UPI000BB012B8|nr:MULTISPECIES: CDP-glucose 4,6-dehydratase [Chitinophaga]ASZ10109.1 CDP-glucose 4,6-dehydratase [Chitinophaga sp. MD30]
MVDLQLLDIFRGKRVLVTGHTGFKGSWLFWWLRRLGADVRGYALAPQTTPSLYEALALPATLSVIADINDATALSREIQAFEPEFVFHLAAQPLVRKSYRAPLDTFQTNVMGTAHVLEAIRMLPGKCTTVLITTDKVYQNKEWVYPYRETDTLGGHDPYSASKACAELLISSYQQSFFPLSAYSTHQKAIASARAGNVIGGGDWSEDRLIPDMVKAFSSGQAMQIRNPDAVRPWQHVLEPLAGYLMLAALLHRDAVRYAGGWNFGPYNDDNLPVSAVAANASELWGSGIVNINKDANAPHEARLLRLDISKVVGELGWKPRIPVKTAIARTINWYKEFYNGAAVDRLLEEDINYYESLF